MDLVWAHSTDDLRCFVCSFTPDDRCFHEHFPGRPVLPGSFVVGLCLRIVHADFGCTRPVRVARFAFRQFAPPGRYDLSVRMDRRGFACALTQENQLFASGRIEPCA